MSHAIRQRLKMLNWYLSEALSEVEYIEAELRGPRRSPLPRKQFNQRMQQLALKTSSPASAASTPRASKPRWTAPTGTPSPRGRRAKRRGAGK